MTPCPRPGAFAGGRQQRSLAGRRSTRSLGGLVEVSTMTRARIRAAGPSAGLSPCPGRPDRPRRMRLQRRQAAAARRRRRRRQPDSGHGPVPRRARSGPAVLGEGCRRDRRQGRPTCRSTATQPSSPCSSDETSTCPTTLAPTSARPACSARSSCRSRRPSDGGTGELGDRDEIPLGHRPEPGGRGGPRRAEPAAQRRRRRAAQDDRQRAEQGAEGPGGLGEVAADPVPRADAASSTTTRPTS